MKTVTDYFLGAHATTARGRELQRESEQLLFERTDRLFANLMVFQWLAGIAAALWLSPQTWIGAQSQVHLHVWAAIILGGAITSFPVYLARTHAGEPITRHTIAVGQMLTSALLIHLSGGRIETHFHVFGSLAFLAIYRDWKVLATATLVTAVDHFARGLLWPQSVFGVLGVSWWRWLEHAGWVVFEDIFLIISIRQSRAEMTGTAERQAKLETVNFEVERQVLERTGELEKAHKELLQISRQAGMAEVATSVLHNVGNVLNSVNVSASMAADHVRQSSASHLGQIAQLFRNNAADIGRYLSEDSVGKQLPAFLDQLVGQLKVEEGMVLGELDQLGKNIDHIKGIVSMQQSYACTQGISEEVNVVELVEDSLRMNAGSLTRHQVEIVRQFEAQPVIHVEKHKVIQILVNLIRNARFACEEAGQKEAQMKVRVTNGGDAVRIAVIDNGVGIPAENLNRIFRHGFTTRKDGHGFGLHSGVLAAREMGGSLSVASEGRNHGATFTLELPLHPTLQTSNHEN